MSLEFEMVHSRSCKSPRVAIIRIADHVIVMANLWFCTTLPSESGPYTYFELSSAAPTLLPSEYQVLRSKWSCIQDNKKPNYLRTQTNTNIVAKRP